MRGGELADFSLGSSKPFLRKRKKERNSDKSEEQREKHNA